VGFDGRITMTFSSAYAHCFGNSLEMVSVASRRAVGAELAPNLETYEHCSRFLCEMGY
jgi:hypothetical protein